jgi:membrane protease YdiL (CAAX protease family)
VNWLGTRQSSEPDATPGSRMPADSRDATSGRPDDVDAVTPSPSDRPGAASAPPPRENPLVVAIVVSIAVTVASYGAPGDYAATAVGAVFLAAVTWLVLRHDTETIRHFGLSLGGLLEPKRIDPRRVVREALQSAAWGVGLATIVAIPFAIGFRIYWHAQKPFVFRLPGSILDEVFGQALVIALPEEAFYRGYLMTSLDDAWGTPWTIAKAKLGWGWFASSAIFAVGHYFTQPDPQRLAVFFPALVFGWLRARTGGVGASALFHVLCNLLAATLSRGYGFGLS